MRDGRERTANLPVPGGFRPTHFVEPVRDEHHPMGHVPEAPGVRRAAERTLARAGSSGLLCT